jgi:hypothetical protein
MALILIASGANREADRADMKPHVVYLEQMGVWAEQAVGIAEGLSTSAGSHKGGRSSDDRLTGLVLGLMVRYREILGIRPTHTINPETGLSTSDLSMFIKEALRLHAPAGMHFEARRLDEIIRKHLVIRDHRLFEPPISDFK